jgi:anti-sigma factor RsiW
VLYDVNHVLERAEVVGWVLGALNPAEARAFEGHLRSCRQCQAAAAEFEPVARALGRAAPATEPPGDLQARTIASVLAAAAGDRDVTA